MFGMMHGGRRSHCIAMAKGGVLTRKFAALVLVSALTLSISCVRDESSNQRAEQHGRQPPPAATSGSEGAQPAPENGTAPDSRDLLVEVTAEVGLPAEEAEWPDGFYLTPEITPGGVALFDYDQDGDLDIYQICHCPPYPMPAAFSEPAPNRLFRQIEGGRFEEVENAAGLDDPGYGHGVAIGDVDNDGDLDVYVTNYGRDAFYLNQGDGTFVDRTAAAGFRDSLWSSAAAFVDYDQDGDLDLVVVHFATFDATRKCGGADIDYCGPHLFAGLPDQLFRNNGDGTFTDVSAAAGITVAARGWGIIATDLTEDGRPDIYVCNDEEPNQLWVNNGDGTFLDEAVFRGVAFNGFGRPGSQYGRHAR